jgi:hypothetical protein
MRFDLEELDALQEELARAYETVAEETRDPALRQRALIIAAAREPEFCQSVNAQTQAYFAKKHGKDKRNQGGEARVLIRLVDRMFDYYKTPIREAYEPGSPELLAYDVAVCLAIPLVRQLSYLPILQDRAEHAGRHTDPSSFARANRLTAVAIADAIIEGERDPGRIAAQVLDRLGCPKATVDHVRKCSPSA